MRSVVGVSFGGFLRRARVFESALSVDALSRFCLDFLFAWGTRLPEMIPDSANTGSMSRTEVHSLAYQCVRRIFEF